jgi:hypothetical protein
MDATRCRRLKDKARQSWYRAWRTYRFARHMGMRPSPNCLGGLAGLRLGFLVIPVTADPSQA